MNAEKKGKSPGRSIRLSVIITMVACFLVMFILLYIVFSTSMNQMLNEREKDSMQARIDMQHNMLTAQLEYIPNITREWAELVYTHDYITGKSDLIYHSHLEPDHSYALNNMNLLAILDKNDTIIFEKYYRFQEKQQVEAPEDLSALYGRFAQQCKSLYSEALLQENPAGASMGFSGFVAQGDNVYYLSAHPVVNFANDLPITGTFLFGRIIDDEELGNLMADENIILSIANRDTADITEEEDTEIERIRFAMHPESDSITAYGLMQDAFGENSLLLSVTNNRNIYAQGKGLINTAIAIVAAGCAAMLLIILKLLSKIVIRPLSHLAAQVRNIDIERDEAAVQELGASQELNTLTSAINHMLALLSNDRNVIKKKNESLYFNANFDPLTHLRNRISAEGLLDEALQKARKDGHSVTLFYLDIDRLKFVNNTWSHSVGNALIQEIARRIQKEYTQEEIVARMSGDEFLICKCGLETTAQREAFAQSIQKIFDEPFRLNERRIETSASIGSSSYPEDGEDPETLIKCAEIAMYNAKETGKGRHMPYQSVFRERFQREAYIEEKLRAAIYDDCRGFSLYYQPKVQAKNGTVNQCEALIRWIAPDGPVYPDEFIPQAEDSGLIIPLTWWVMDEACRFAAKLRDAGHPTRIAVNIPAQVLMQDEFIDKLKTSAKKAHIAPNCLDVEITERTLLEDEERVSEVFDALQKLDVEISVDDFGTGYSSLSYLNKLSVNRIKIDRSFISAINGNDDGRTIVRAIIAMAKNLGVAITAEGVEDNEQFCFLSDCDCDEIQGYLFCRPVPGLDYLSFVEKWDGSDLRDNYAM